MLSRAVKEHHPAPSLHSSSSQDSSKTQAFKPTQASLLNSRSSWPSANPLKRSASEMTGNYGGHQERIEKRPGLHPHVASSLDSGRLGKLSSNVFFDENDFDDDIDLDAEPPAMSGTFVSSANSAKPRDSLPPMTTGTTMRTPASSAPLPWSSSPSSHATMRPPAAVKVKPKLSPAITSSRDTIDKTTDSLPKAKEAINAKRRKLPWSELEGESQKRFKDEAMSTPMPKREVDVPWNKTASAVKEEQKEMRRKKRKEASTDKQKVTQVGKKNIARVFLSDEQKHVCDLVAEKKQSVFFTGSAGTGKSVLLRETIKILRDKHRREPDRIAVTASTGLAACNIGGVTLHSFAGIGLGKEPVPELVKKIKKSQKAKQRWLRTKVLIIDEISMVDGELFDKLESIARAIRNNGRPFGGLQLVITGDFFQLPPVPDSGREAKFAFDASSWATSIGHTIGLTQVFRQKDAVFANMLNEMRLGKLTPKSIQAFRALSRDLGCEDSRAATELFPTRNEVDNANNTRMRGLTGPEREYNAIDAGSIQDPVQRTRLLQNCMAPASIKLKKGAQVMMIKNIDETIVNGSVGRVMAFMDEKMYDMYTENEHDFGATDENDMSEEGQRKRNLSQRFGNLNAGAKLWPVVDFTLPDGTRRAILVHNETWKIELPNGEVQASRQQIPLILAWALSIHKAQGQTLERVRVDLGKIFEKGQAYVALSRATSQEGLQILRFEPSKVMAHEKVRKFYDSLYSANQAIAKSVPVKDEDDKEVKRDKSQWMEEFGFDSAEEDEVAIAKRPY